MTEVKFTDSIDIMRPEKKKNKGGQRVRRNEKIENEILETTDNDTPEVCKI